MPHTTLTCYKASSCSAGRPPISDAHIHIERSLSEEDLQRLGLESWRNLYRDEARHLAAVLGASLPQGTMHELLIVLLEQYASVYRGTTTEAGPLVRTGADGRLS